MQGKKFEQLDSLRFFAIFGVLIAHWSFFGSNFAVRNDSGSRGVDLFFVISGFLITLGLLRAKEKDINHSQSLYKFYVRRFLRIFPIYYLCLALVWYFQHDKVKGAMLWYLSYTSNFYSIKIQDWGGMGHLWSLAVEEQFYFVWPLLILFSPRKLLIPVISFAVLLSVAAKSYWWYNSVPFWTPYMHPLGALDVLALGALLSVLYHFHTDWLKNLVYNPLFVTIILIQVLVCLVCKDADGYQYIYHVGMRFSYGIFCAWLIGRAVFGFGGTIGYILNSRALQYIGKISYAIYLLNPFAPDLLQWLKYPAVPTLRFCLYFILTIGLAALSWNYFESKILKLKAKFE